LVVVNDAADEWISISKGGMLFAAADLVTGRFFATTSENVKSVVRAEAALLSVTVHVMV
jgi:hypothetical protein